MARMPYLRGQAHFSHVFRVVLFSPRALQARQDLEQVKNIAGKAAQKLTGMASKFMSDLGRY